MKFLGMAALAAAVGVLASGCANDGTLSTAAITPKAAASAETAAKIDPACPALAAQIETLRNDGTVGRLEQAATGKGKSVQVKREALSKQAELNKANAEFQAKCAPKIPAATAQAAPQPAQTAANAATNAATQAAKSAATQQTQQAATKAATSAVKQP